MPLRHAETIQLKAPTIKALPDDIRTPQRDEVARYILNDVLPSNRWPMQMTELAEETGYSRQHVTNVVKLYFTDATETSEHESDAEMVDMDRVDRQGIRADQLNIQIPDNVVNRESYVRGWVSGYTQGQNE